ncbi:MAG: hypothetical protein WDA71_03845 [Actinomycetota bacterium]
METEFSLLPWEASAPEVPVSAEPVVWRGSRIAPRVSPGSKKLVRTYLTAASPSIPAAVRGAFLRSAGAFDFPVDDEDLGGLLS